MSGPDLVDPNLTNQVLNLPVEERYSFVFRGSAQVLDHALTTTSLDPDVTGYAYGRGNAGAPLVLLDDASTPLRASDHDGLVLFVELQKPFPGTAVLAAGNSISIDTNSDVESGDILVREAATGEVLGDGVELTIGRRVTTAAGYQVKADDISIFRQAVVSGDVFYNTLDNDGSIAGSETTPLELPVFDFPPFPSFTAGTDDFMVQSGKTQALEAGSYGDVTVRPGATLVLSGSMYEMASLTIQQAADVVFQVPGELRIADVLDASQKSTIGPEEGAAFDASDIVIYVAGINGAGGGLSDEPPAVSFGQVAKVDANIFAPNGKIEFFGNAQVAGAFLAKDLEVGRNVTMTLDSYWGATPVQPVAARTGRRTDQLVLSDETIEIPETFDLGHNYPNPFNPMTSIPFSLPEATHVRIVVYDLLGRALETLIDQTMDAGYHHATFDAKSYPSGAYLYRIEAGSFTATQKMMLVK